MLKKIKYISLLLLVSFICGCAAMAITAQEYYLLGMAYFELGKYEEAERWLNRAAQADRTMTASKYNLGRLAYERQRYDEAAKHFEDILKIDKDNVLALKAAAYTRIKTGDIAKAEKHYARLLELVPESSDDGYNHALVLYAMKRYSDAEAVLDRYPFALQENREAHLLHARSQAAQNKLEAIDNFSSWLTVNSDPKVRYEYAKILESHEFYARALEEYRKTHSETSSTSEDPYKYEVRFAIGKVLLIADGENSEGIAEIQGAVNEGFNDIEAVEELLSSNKISLANKNSLRTIYDNIRKAASEKEENIKRQNAEEDENDWDSSETDAQGDAD